MLHGMNRLLKLQFVGPAVVLLAIAAAESAVIAVASAPSSATSWYIASHVFEPFRRGEDVLGAQLGIAHVQLCLIALPLFLVACSGLLFKWSLALGIASNLSFLYVCFLLYACYADLPMRMDALASIDALIESRGVVQLGLFGSALLSFAVSHLAYIRDICNELG
jgi:hypothetical protein